MPTVATFPDLISAQLAQSLLEAEGIESTIPEEHLAGIDWRMSTALQGIRLQVSDDDFAAAEALLAQPAEPEPQEAAAAEEERCPHCGSDLMGPGRWRRRAKALTLLAPFLLLFWPLIARAAPAYECLRCGRRWREVS